MDEKANALTLLQMQDPHGRGEEPVIGDLEQQIARKSLQDIDQCLGGVTAARIACPRHGSRNLLPQQRDRARAAIVRSRGVETQKAPLSDDFSVRIEAFDTDVVQVAGAVHGGARVGLGNRQQGGFPGEAANLRRKAREGL